ncbi:MAG: hypothetical protein KC583_16670 [Myxococcales bacterium]|nr:hypothetical protein [Myxococcales bacterium]
MNETALNCAHELLQRLAEVMPDADLHVERTPMYWRIRVPTAPPTPFHFLLYVYDDAEVQIGVDLPDAPPNHSWYVPFERPDFPDDDARFELFWTTVGRLLRSPVRFTSRRHRWLFCFEVTDVHLEMMLEGGWTHVQHPIEPSRGPNLNPGGRVVRVWTSSPWATGKSQRREPAGDGSP